MYYKILRNCMLSRHIFLIEFSHLKTKWHSSVHTRRKKNYINKRKQNGTEKRNVECERQRGIRK